jgi:hypothetical protein
MQMDISSYLDNTPEKIKSSFVMKEPNETIPIYQGRFSLKGDAEIEIDGRIDFSWLPNMNVRFEGTAVKQSLETMKLLNERTINEVYISGSLIGKFEKTNTTYQFDSSSTIIEGRIRKSITGDKSVSVTKINFTVANLRDFIGDSTKEEDNEKIQITNSRLTFENDEYSITIDKLKNYEDLKKSLKSKGGYLILYAGELIKKNSSISFKESDDVLRCFSVFLTFINGRRTSPVLRKGIYEDSTIWTDYTPYIVDSYTPVLTWPQAHSIKGLNELWQSFYKLWKAERDFLTTAIHWYTESNLLKGFTEGSIIMAQTALELIYNWLLIENKKLLVGKDADNISAANKIRLLLAQLNVPNSVPSGLVHLHSFIENDREIIDAPECFVQIRNALVHAQGEKRKKLTKIPPAVKFETLQLGIWYIELALLYVLGFDQKYFNRCFGSKWVGDGEESVPWHKTQL